MKPASSPAIRCALLLPVVLLAASSSLPAADSAPPAAPAAPADASKAKAAEGPIRAVLTYEEFASRTSRYSSKFLSRAAVEADKSPEWGVQIGQTMEDGQAKAAGLGPGWIITRCNDREIWHRKQELDPEREDRQLTIISPQGEEEFFHFHPGAIGMKTANHRRLEKTVMRQIPPGTWDRDVLIAVRAWALSDHEVVETAMNHAVAKGMPSNPVADFYAALLLLDRGDFAQARSLCDRVLATFAPDNGIPRFYRQGMRTLAVGLRDIALLKRSAEELGELEEELKLEQVKKWEAAGLKPMKESLLMLAQSRAGEELMPEVVAPQDGWQQMYAAYDPKMLAKSFAAVPIVGRYVGFAFVPPRPVHDFIWEVKGFYGEAGTEPGDRAFDIGIFDRKLRAEYGGRTSWQPAAWRVAYISSVSSERTDRTTSFYNGPDGGVIETSRRIPRLSDRETEQFIQSSQGKASYQQPPDSHSFDITFIRIGNEVEILVNGVSYQRLPIPATVGDLGCELQASGCALAVMSSSLKEIKP